MDGKRTHKPKGEGSLYRHTDGRWMYSVMHNGKRQTKSLGTRDEAEALKKYRQVRNNFLGKIDRGDLDPSTQANVKLGELLDEYVKHIKQNQYKSASVVAMVIDKVRQAPEFVNRKVSSLETSDFKRYRERVTLQGSSQSTVNNHFALIRAALHLERKQTPSRVAKVPHIPIVSVKNARQGFLEYADHYTVLEHLPRSLKALFVVAFHSGCRQGELLKMLWRDVDWTNRIVRLPDSKNGKARNLPFWGGIEAALTAHKTYRDEHYPDCAHLFFWMEEDSGLGHGGLRNVPGSPIQDFRGSWSQAITKAHKDNENVLPKLLFHDIRRSGVRVMVQDAGIPEAQAMLISGHETRSMLDRYNIVSLKNLQDAGAKLDAWSRQQGNVVRVPGSTSEANPKQMPSQEAGERRSDAPKTKKKAGVKRRKTA
jgi:integrase